MGGLGLSTVIDCATRKVVGWAMDDNYRTPLINSAIGMGIPLRVSAERPLFYALLKEAGILPASAALRLRALRIEGRRRIKVEADSPARPAASPWCGPCSTGPPAAGAGSP